MWDEIYISYQSTVPLLSQSKAYPPPPPAVAPVLPTPPQGNPPWGGVFPWNWVRAQPTLRKGNATITKGTQSWSGSVILHASLALVNYSFSRKVSRQGVTASSLFQALVQINSLTLGLSTNVCPCSLQMQLLSLDRSCLGYPLVLEVRYGGSYHLPSIFSQG